MYFGQTLTTLLNFLREMLFKTNSSHVVSKIFCHVIYIVSNWNVFIVSFAVILGASCLLTLFCFTFTWPAISLFKFCALRFQFHAFLGVIFAGIFYRFLDRKYISLFYQIPNFLREMEMKLCYGQKIIYDLHLQNHLEDNVFRDFPYGEKSDRYSLNDQRKLFRS